MLASSSNNYKLHQYRRLIQDGVDSRDAARATGMEIEETNLALMAASKIPVTIEEIIEKARPEAIEVLISVMRGDIMDCRPGDRVKAAQIILENKGIVPDIASNALAERLAKMKLAKENIVNTQIIELVEA